LAAAATSTAIVSVAASVTTFVTTSVTTSDTTPTATAYSELKRHQKAPGADAAAMHHSVPEAYDMSTLHFSEWFTWCQSCKHG